MSKIAEVWGGVRKYPWESAEYFIAWFPRRWMVTLWSLAVFPFIITAPWWQIICAAALSWDLLVTPRARDLSYKNDILVAHEKKVKPRTLLDFCKTISCWLVLFSTICVVIQNEDLRIWVAMTMLVYVIYASSHAYEYTKFTKHDVDTRDGFEGVGGGGHWIELIYVLLLAMMPRRVRLIITSLMINLILLSIAIGGGYAVMSTVQNPSMSMDLSMYYNMITLMALLFIFLSAVFLAMVGISKMSYITKYRYYSVIKKSLINLQTKRY